VVVTTTQNKTKIEMASILNFRKIHAGPRYTRMEEMSYGQRRVEVTFEGGQGPEGAVAPHMDGWIIQFCELLQACRWIG
jgi:hypothetical protein